MRILWVKVGGLWPVNVGGRQRSFHIISELAQRHRVILVTTHGPDDDPRGQAEALRGCQEVISIPYALPRHGTARFAPALVRSWLSRYPVDVWKCRIAALRKEVTRLLSEARVDLCVADFLVATPNVPLNGPVPVVLFAHNADQVIWKRLAQNAGRGWRRPLLELESRKMRRYEAEVCARVTRTLTVSDIDRQVLTAVAPRARIAAIPTGVDTSYFTPNGSREVPASLIFTGAMDYFPNEEGILYFLDEILPASRREMPGVSLTVVGRNPGPRLLAAAAGDGVRVTGTVDDVRPYVAEAAVFVVPLRVGGGTRLKIFEALAMGKAVVSTAVGAEGLPLVPGEHFVQADNPDDFAHAVVSLLRDPVRRRTLGIAGRRLVEERYSWRQVAQEFEARCVEVTRRSYAR